MNVAQAAKDKLAANPAIEPELWAAWNRVCDRVQDHATKARPKMKVFEVHHLTEIARGALLAAFVADESIETAESKALSSIGLD